MLLKTCLSFLLCGTWSSFVGAINGREYTNTSESCTPGTLTLTYVSAGPGRSAEAHASPGVGHLPLPCATTTVTSNSSSSECIVTSILPASTETRIVANTTIIMTATVTLENAILKRGASSLASSTTSKPSMKVETAEPLLPPAASTLTGADGCVTFFYSPMQTMPFTLITVAALTSTKTTTITPTDELVTQPGGRATPAAGVAPNTVGGIGSGATTVAVPGSVGSIPDTGYSGADVVSAIPPVTSAPLPSPTFVFAGSTYTANVQSAFVIAGTSLVPGGDPVTISDTVLSVRLSAFDVIASPMGFPGAVSTIAVGPLDRRPITFTAAASTVVVSPGATSISVGGTTIGPGSPPLTLGGGTVLSFGPTLSAGAQPILTIASPSGTAVIPFPPSELINQVATPFTTIPGPSLNPVVITQNLPVVINGETLTAGGSAQIILGTRVSLAPGDNFIVIGSTTIFLHPTGSLPRPIGSAISSIEGGTGAALATYASNATSTGQIYTTSASVTQFFDIRLLLVGSVIMNCILGAVLS